MDTLTLFGMVAATLTTVAFLPQAIRVIKTKHTKAHLRSIISNFDACVMKISGKIWKK